MGRSAMRRAAPCNDSWAGPVRTLTSRARRLVRERSRELDTAVWRRCVLGAGDKGRGRAPATDPGGRGKGVGAARQA